MERDAEDGGRLDGASGRKVGEPRNSEEHRGGCSCDGGNPSLDFVFLVDFFFIVFVVVIVVFCVRNDFALVVGFGFAIGCAISCVFVLVEEKEKEEQKSEWRRWVC